MKTNKNLPVRRDRVSLGGLLVAAAGGWILYSHYGINHRMPLPEAIPADRISLYSKTAGRLSYYVDRSGTDRPLVLIHSVNAAASAYEVRPLFEAYRGKRPVYALDLPGFGFSERSDRIYSSSLYANAICEFIASEIGEAVDVIALSLGCEFAAAAALERPELFHSLAFLSPTGLNQSIRGSSSRLAQLYGLSNGLHLFLSFPVWAKPLFDFIATQSSVEFFLKRSFIGPVPRGLVEYAYTTAHQPGAEYAPLYFLSGKLFARNAFEVLYARLKTPTLAIYDRDIYTGFNRLPDLLLRNPAWQAVRLVPSLGMMHFERPQDTVDILANFYRGLK
ncbi:MAG: alpha/beta hydrolase [Anaerolineae bacterium]|nr:alpha/beta hydrolase [Anaerolineae bacterium]